MFRRLCLGALLGCSVALAGCHSTEFPNIRGQSAEETEKDKDLEIRCVGDVTEVSNVNPITISGVGLITHLDGTGGTPPGTYRGLLEQELRKRKVENIKQMLDSPDNALVLVNAVIPPGCRKADAIDIEVSIPPGSKATSLKGGYLQECTLRNYEAAKNINPDAANRLLPGHILGKAKGWLMIGLTSNEEEGNLRHGRVWSGGVAFIDRPLHFVLKSDEKSARIASAVADKLNVNFQEDPQRARTVANAQRERLLLLGDIAGEINTKQEVVSTTSREMAKAISRETIALRMPYAYRHNIERYIRVARLTPLREDMETMSKYRGRLKKMLHDPSETIRAALRLEAMGKDAIPMLKAGLADEHPLVRFACAESLTYLGSTNGVQELATLADQHPPLRAYCLIALASLDESVCRTKLCEMFASDDPELRMGAFQSLKLLDERDPQLNGEQVAQTFWLHRVAPESDRLVQFSLGKKAEVILFGTDHRLKLPVKIAAGAGSEFIVTSDLGDDRVTISRITVDGQARKQCSMGLEDVLRTMANMGARYPDIVDFLRNLDEQHCLNCQVKLAVAPSTPSVETLADGGRDPNFLKEPRSRTLGSSDFLRRSVKESE
ncbi:MAG: flagellar basal body P-ring protein FlgI [Gemmataceae bacterium]|nr:flagellar basal body P-ring protein FlgI [Gemmataceae bacterium]